LTCAFLVPATAVGESLFYDGTDTSLLETTPSTLPSPYGDIPNSLFPGSAANLLASGNRVVVDFTLGATPSVAAVVGGAAIENQVAQNNFAYLLNGWLGGHLIGGFAYNASGTATATDNTTDMRNGIVGFVIEPIVSFPANVFGGMAEAGSTGSTGMAKALDNTTNIRGGTVTLDFYGGYAKNIYTGTATAEGNIVNIRDGKMSSVFGGYADGGTIKEDDKSVTYGSANLMAKGNTVNISGGSISGGVYGGYARYSTGSLAATGNTVNISGGVITGSVIGGWVIGKEGNANHNTITISGNPTIGTNLIGGFVNFNESDQSDYFTGNTLNFKTTGLTVSGIEYFQYFNFSLPGNIVTGTPMLTATGVLNYGASVDEITFDIRTPGSFFLDANSNTLDGTYTLLRNKQKSLDGINYSLYDAEPDSSSADSRTWNLTAGRVRGDFTVKIVQDGENKDLQLTISNNSYQAPNTTSTSPLTWTGKVDGIPNNLWANYSTNPTKSQANWKGIAPIGGSSETALKYLDGDVVIFGNTGAGTVNIHKEGVTPDTVTFQNTGNNSYTLTGGAVTGTTLTKTGGGKLTLANDNTFTQTTVSNGILQIGKGGKTGSIQGDIVNNAELIFNRSNAIYYEDVISGSGSLEKTGAGTLILSNNHSYTDLTTITAGTLQIGDGGTTGSIQGDIVNKAKLVFFRSDDLVYDRIISGAGSLEKIGAGTLTLSKANTYSGDTTIINGMLAVTGSLGNGNYTGKIANDGTLKFDQDSTNQTLSDAISGKGSLVKSGTGMLTLYGGLNQASLALDAGGLSLIGGATLSGSTGTFSAGDDTTLGLSVGVGNTPALSAKSATIDSNVTLDVLDYGGDDTKTLIHTDQGISGIDDSFAKTLVGGTDTTLGGLNVFLSASTSKVNDGKDLQIEYGLVWKKTADKTAHGHFNVTKEFILNTGLADNDKSSAWMDGWDGKSLTKTGTGKLILSGKNEYTGDTTVSKGILELAATGSLQSNVTVKVDATFTLRGTVGKVGSVGKGGTGERVVGNGKDVLLESGSFLNAYQGSKITGNLSTPDNGSATLNFYLPQDIDDQGVLLTVGGMAAIINGTIRLLFEEGSYDLTNLDKGEKITLIDRDSGSDIALPDDIPDAELVGAARNYGLRFMQSEDGKDLQAELYSIDGDGDDGDDGGDDDDDNDDNDVNNGDGDNRGSNTSTKVLAEGFLAGTALLNQGADFLIGPGLAAALETGPESARLGLHAFAALGGGKLRHKTGSHIDVDGAILIAGLSATRAVQAGDLTLGAFFEHGEGDYSTHTSLGNGRGEARYSGGGLLAHFKFNETPRGTPYAEATARFGLADLDFTAGADRSRSGYASAHVGLGYVLKLDDYSALNLYGRYFWNRHGSDTVRLTTGSDVKFEAVESRRTRLGLRWNSQNASRTGEFYFGAAWEREHDGESKTRPRGDWPMPKLKGNTTLVEAGFIFNPVKPLTLEFGVQGHTGRREGVTGSVKVEYRF
jgi:autotransporter-associated beta strand protein